MQRIAPAGDVYQAGTLSGNPLAVAAGLAALKALLADDRAAYGKLETTSAALQEGLEQIAAKHGVPVRVHRQGSMLGLFFSDAPVRSIADVDASDRQLFQRVFHALLEHGVHLPPSPYETLFVSLAHGDEEIDLTLEAFDGALETALAEAG